MNGPTVFQSSRLADAARRCAAMMSRALRDDSGASAVEFAFVGPLMVMLLVSGTELGIAFYNKNALTQVATQAARIFSESRSVSTTPYSDTTTAITNALANYTTITASSVTTTIKSNGVTCTDNTCAMAAGNPAQVSLSYPCVVGATNWTLFLWSAPDTITNCTLSASATMRIE